MASLIFRRYWVDNEPRDIATLGDVSLTKDLRARGFGRGLMEFIGRHLSAAPDHDGLAIPSKPDEACLGATGWRTSGALVPHVYLIDPTDAFVRLVRHPWLARSAAAVFKRVMPTALRVMNPGTRSAQTQRRDDRSARGRSAPVCAQALEVRLPGRASARSTSRPLGRAGLRSLCLAHHVRRQGCVTS
jgi:hypothetical protein